MTRQRIRDIRNDELIEAAIHAVYEHGFAIVTMSEIAKRAGTSAASINYYFGSKEKLMEAVMLRLLGSLQNALLSRLAIAKTPRERLFATIDANFDANLFTPAQASVWVQFWAHAPYSPRLARLQNINRARVRSNLCSDLYQLQDKPSADITCQAMQAYIDGVWIEAAQSSTPIESVKARTEAARILNVLLTK
jgi:TetR/AcrR family transcriptional repressor of bet genes